MKRLFWALLLFVPFLTQGQNKSIFFSSGSPEFVPYGKPFDIFITATFPDFRFDEINIYLFSDSRLPVNEVSVYNEGNIVKKKTEDTEYGNFDYALKLKISKADTLFNFNSVFRFKYSFASLYDEKLSIHYAVEFVKNRKVINAINSLGKNPAINPTRMSFYKPQQIAGRCLLLQEGAKLKIKAESVGEHSNLLSEFWVKAGNANSDFFRILNSETGDEYFSLGVNENNFINLSDFSKMFYSGYSLSRNSWYHAAVYMVNNKVMVYLNRRLIYENILYKQIKENPLEFVFLNESPESNIYIKQFRLWDFREDIEKCFANRQYSYYSAERSELLYQNLFNDELYPEEGNAVKISEVNRIRTVQSDAPIISRAPEVNITVFSTYCTIEWSNKDNQRPKNFIVEKSRDGSSFAEVFKTTADEDLNKTYYYSDKRDEFENIAYYRVRQINYDGSDIYSASIKVGQSAKKENMRVGQNYPNPFNPSTSFTVEMLETADAVISVYDLVGKTIKTLHEGTLAKGTHTFSFDGSSLPSGIYFYEVKTPSSSIIKKMILTK